MHTFVRFLFCVQFLHLLCGSPVRIIIYTASPVNSSTTGWDDRQYNGDQGFSLITPRQDPGGSYRGLSFLPIRLARRPNSNILSIGQFQQVNLSKYSWQPAFPVGNSWAGVYVDREAAAGIHTRKPGIDIGWTGAGRLPQFLPNTMAFSFNDVYEVQVPANSMLDLSYVLNENIWDRYFLSSIEGTPDPDTPLPNSRHRYAASAGNAGNELTDFDLAAAHLRNHGAFNVNSTSVEAWKALLMAFRNLKLGDNPDDTVPVARTLDPIGDSIRFTFENGISDSDIGLIDNGLEDIIRDYTRILNGFRYLDDSMVEALAERIVDEVRLRGPFYSVADFVNRRLVAPQGSNQNDPFSPWQQAGTNGWSDGSDRSNNRLDFIPREYDPFIGLQGISGALQRALDVSGVNGGVNHPYFGFDGSGTGNPEDRVFTPRIRFNPPDFDDVFSFSQFDSGGIGGISNSEGKHTHEPTLRNHVDTEHLAGAPAGEAGFLLQGAPGFITQGDLLTMLGPALTARGDTFLIRAYGDAVDPGNGITLATARLEAVVQRTPVPVEPSTEGSADGIPAKWIPATAEGREFHIVGFRWLDPDEK
jgi:hypothetical protein